MKPAIIVENLSKKFRRFNPDRPSTIQEAVARGLRWKRSVEYSWALRELTFTVGAGTTTGIIGSNGSGKSTLLRLIGGVGRPDSGRVEVHGRIGALLDLGAGFHPDLTGRENAYLAGLLNGLTRRELDVRFDAIVTFAELEKAIDSPMRAYSTGMLMRLAFATAVHTDPEILLIDEVLSVGDLAFQRKCLDRIAEFRSAGCSILLVSHEASVIEEMCDDAIWINKGRLMAQGAAAGVVQQYRDFMERGSTSHERTGEISDAIPASPIPATVRTEDGGQVVLDQQRFGIREVELTAVRVLDAAGNPASELRAGDSLRVEIDYSAVMRVVAPIFCVRVERHDGVVCYVLTTRMSNVSLTAIEGKGRIAVDVERLDLNSGRYTVDASCYANGWIYAYDYRLRVGSFTIQGDDDDYAVLNAPCRWDISTIDEPPPDPRAAAAPQG
jgi:lipopolysaccharide transport system ATP-binding protein